MVEVECGASAVQAVRLCERAISGVDALGRALGKKRAGWEEPLQGTTADCGCALAASGRAASSTGGEERRGGEEAGGAVVVVVMVLVMVVVGAGRLVPMTPDVWLDWMAAGLGAAPMNR